MPSERSVQTFIHRMEEGVWATRLRVAALIFFAIAMIVALLFDPMGWRLFKGLSHAKGMEQAEIAREIASGNGFSTKVIRPMAVSQFYAKKGEFPRGPIPDTYHGPLWPATLALTFATTGFGMEPIPIDLKEGITPDQLVYSGDKAVLIVSVLFLYAAIAINFLTIRRLFDSKIAWLTLAVTFLCHTLWMHAMSGLPQTFIFFLLSLTLLFMSRIVMDKPGGWRLYLRLAAVALLCGLLALTHALTIWLFLGLLTYVLIAFPARWRTLLVMAGVFLLLYAPWMVRNYRVSGFPMGVSWYSALHGTGTTESAVMRSAEVPRTALPLPRLRRKIQTELTQEVERLVDHLGGAAIAPLFFLALLYPFRNEGPRRMRWLFLSMWLFVSLGSALWAADDRFGIVSATDLFVLFVPFFAAYGFAFLFVMLGRTHVRHRIIRYSVIILALVLSAAPMLNYLSRPMRTPFHWPPYIPPYIAILSQWVKPNEVLASDAPAAVAWYADRKSLLLPMELARFVAMSDENQLNAPFAGVYLTPFTGNLGLLNEIIKGEYKEWHALIMRSQHLPNFPFTARLPLPLDAQCIFYADWPRWSPQERDHAAEVSEESLIPKEKEEEEAPKAGPPEKQEAEEE